MAEVVGYITIACLVIASTAIVTAVAYSSINYIAEKRRDQIRWNKAAEVGNEIISASWWFGESKETQLALRLLGQSLMQYRNFSADKIRDEWRRAFGKEAGS